MLCFSSLQMVVLNDFVLFLKQESGSRAQGSKAQSSKARGMKKASSEVSHASSKIKNILNSIYTTLQAETLIFSFICLYFPVSGFAPGGRLLRLIHMRVQHVSVYRYKSTSDQWSYFHENIHIFAEGCGGAGCPPTNNFRKT